MSNFIPQHGGYQKLIGWKLIGASGKMANMFSLNFLYNGMQEKIL